MPANSLNSFKENESCGSGNGSEGTCQIVSLKSPKDSILVASIFNVEDLANNCSTYCAQALIRCSQLSTTIKSSLDSRYVPIVFMRGSFAVSRTRNEWAISCGIRFASDKPTKLTQHTPSLNLFVESCAA